MEDEKEKRGENRILNSQIERQFQERSKREALRLNKFLSEAGVCSRREADRLIEAGRVTVDGKKAGTGMKITPGQEVRVDQKLVKPEEEMIVLAVNKPRGIVCTEEKREPDNIIRFLNYPTRITYAGRLDKDSEGLLLMTNNGDIINKMMRAGNYHEKEYLVTVDKPVTEEFLKHMARGVPILDTVTRPCQVKKEGKKTFRIILTQGLNRQIRRMCEALGYKVVTLKRVRIMQIRLGDLKPGQYRTLTEQELASLDRMLEHSSNMPERDRKNRERKENRRQKP
ncbi:23S rRNA pseudouridine(2604) synthase RluF [Pseudoflavonifractor sp. BSD2780061688st1 E11]|uniref:23S rRNA pseudouridine(2604) synthase RluF n=1 Tax=Oscillospiraceae TaxID=216572 RepID=UPI00325AF174